jgi:FkbM family methyltransferase
MFRQALHFMSKGTRIIFQKVGQKVSRLGDVIQQPRLLSVRLRGIDVRMFESLYKPWLVNADIHTIFDVGANTGQFARAIHEILPEAYIYAFEPLADCFTALERAMRHVTHFQAFNTALGDKEGEAVFYRSAWSPSSSLRPMGHLHKEYFPDTAQQSQEIVRVRRLDDYADALKIQDNVLVKLDVQGCEDKVIQGGERLLQRVKILIVETSMVPLYEGQPLFRDLFMMLDHLRFTYHGELSQFASPIDGSILQTDAIFMRDARPCIGTLPKS